MNKREVLGAIGYYSKKSAKPISLLLLAALVLGVFYLASLKLSEIVSLKLDGAALARVNENHLQEPEKVTVEKTVLVKDDALTDQIEALRKEVDSLR